VCQGQDMHETKCKSHQRKNQNENKMSCRFPVMFPYDKHKMQWATKKYVMVIYQIFVVPFAKKIFVVRSQKKPIEQTYAVGSQLGIDTI
jgi:hypothetical protein